MNQIGIGEMVAVLLTIAGWVIAKGFWWTVLAVCFPPFAWYLVVDAVLKSWGMV